MPDLPLLKLDEFLGTKCLDPLTTGAEFRLDPRG